MRDCGSAASARGAVASRRWIGGFGAIFGWIWAIVAGGGGLWLLWTKGPWPLTNGWFALGSGVSACPLTAWMIRKTTGAAVSGRVQFVFALLFFFIAGRIALK